MLRQRLLLGPILLLLLIGALWLDEWLDGRPVPPALAGLFPDGSTSLPPGLAILGVGLVIVIPAARELAAIFKAGGIKASRRWLGIAAAAGLLVSAAVPTGSGGVRAVALVATVGTGILLCAVLWHIRRKTLQGATAAAGSALFAYVYLGLMFGFVLALRREHSAWVVLGVLVVTKSCDIGAYFTGRAIGRHKLIPWVSPGKTWEGLVGGMGVAALCAVGAVKLAEVLGGALEGVGSVPLWAAAAAGMTFAVMGQAGDLLASVLKRDAQIKDSGRSLPGFGGVLDVLDSVILVAPVAYWILGPVGAAR